MKRGSIGRRRSVAVAGGAR